MSNHHAAIDDDPLEVAVDDAEAQRWRFRRELVELMLALVEAWERSTGHNRIELAERSRIWRVNIDDGRLRAINTGTGEVMHELVGHEDAVAAVAIERGGDYAVSCGSDCTFRVWS